MKVTKIKPPKKNEIDSYYIAGDWHSDHLNLKTYEILVKTARLYHSKKQRKLIINGDFLDASHLMRRSPDFRKWIKRSDGIEEYFLPESERELMWGNDVLDELQKTFSEIIFIEGNHDWRYREFMGIAPPAYAHNFNYIQELNFQKRGIKVIKYNDWLDLGNKLCVTHGMYHGTTCHKKHYEACGGNNVIFSHIHSYGCKSFQVRGDTRQAWSLPAMCDLNPHYIKNSETNWCNGFGLINLRSDSTFHFNVFQVWKDRIVLPNGDVLS